MVQRYENGSNKLNVENIQNVAAALEMPAAIFFKPDNVLVAEFDTAYFDRDEQQLFKLFRTISEPSSRSLLIDVARLAARNN
jgi:transcriptional regulator with XRE-family HTH domain